MPSPAKDRFTVDFERCIFFPNQNGIFSPSNLSQLKAIYLTPEGHKVPKEPMRKMGQIWRFNACSPWFLHGRRSPGSKQTMRLEDPDHSIFLSSLSCIPQQLVETPILAGCLENGIVLDPFVGSGTTCVVAQRLGRKFIGIDLNPDYVRMAKIACNQQYSRIIPLPHNYGQLAN